MKKILKPLFCAAALVSLAGCNKFDEANATPETSNGSLIKVYANVAENDGTRANIHVGESAFTAEWEAGDALGILPVKTGGTAPATAAKFDYNTTSAAFEGSLNDFAAGGGNYYAFFPHAQVSGTTAKLPFGNLRTQAGNDFNSAYDALVATPRAYTADDEAGKADGKDVTFTLHRLTSILNFSIATPADKVKYLLLTAGGETQKLSASSLDFGLENGGAETVASLSTTDQSNVIALQYTPDAAGGDHVEAFFNGTTEGISLEPVDKYNVRLTLSDAFFASCQAGDQKVTLRIEDANGGSSEVATTYRLEGLVPVTADDYDLWANTVTLRVVSFTPGTTVQFGLRSSGGEWQPMAGTSQGDDFITATYAPQWVPQTVKEQTVYTQAAGTGIIATHSYDFRAIINGTETTGTFTAGEVQPIPNGDMSGWSMTGGFAFPNAAGESFWSSGNNTMTKTLCTSTDVKFGKSAPAAKLTSTNMLVLAAGNLFTGEFAYKSFTGTVQFGQTYAFTARPSAMKVKYHAHVGTVDKVRTSGDICPYIKKGDPDMARIFVAIVDWNAPHEVVSGMTTTKGAWDPEKGIDNVSEGKILGYGSLWITQSTDGEDMQDAELDIVWYDHETRPAEGKYSLVISCACNAYGDYFTGCSKNVMYVDDFEWVY